MNPIFSHPYPVPKVQEEMFKNEVESLVLTRVLQVANDSEWGSPYFAQPKHESNKVSLLSDFINLNI